MATTSEGEMCFLTKLENDLQSLFDELYNHKIMRNPIIVKNLLKKCINSVSGDFVLSLKSVDSLLHVKEKLITKLCSISYIIESKVDQQSNLILFLNRSELFRKVLKNVMIYQENYGMKKLNGPYFVLVHGDKITDFDSLRVALVADHFISFLSANGANVYVNSYKSYSELSKKVHSHVCCNDCSYKIKLLSSQTEHEKLFSESRNDDNYITINGKTCINKDTMSCRFGSDVGDIKLIKNGHDPFVELGAYIAHFDFQHEPKLNVFMHVCLQSQRHKIIKSALLIEMLDKIESLQYFLTCQNTRAVADFQITVDFFIDWQRKVIENAMVHKYTRDILHSTMWTNYKENLVDTALKFYFLKAGTNISLKIALSSDKNDGIFVQYNYARLLNLFKNFQLKVEQGYYRPLCLLEETDFQLLELKEEWNLLSFILFYPRLIEETFDLSSEKTVFHVNKICIMLIKLSHAFSVYYSKTQVLGGQQLHLQKLMHARLWLLKGIYQIISNSFIMLNIQGLEQM